MADHDEQERFQELQEMTLAAFEYIRALLINLPVPLAIEDFDPTRTDSAHTLMGLHRAIALIGDEPIPEGDKHAYGHLILDWFAAYEMLVLRKLAGPAPWRLDCAEYALGRLATLGEMIELGETGDDLS